MSQTEIAEKLKVSQALISGWETGKSFPDEKCLEKLTKILGPLGKMDGHQLAEDPSDIGPSPFGVWLNRMRQENDLTVPQLAGKSNVAIPTIYAIENGVISNPRSTTVQKLERALKTKVPEDTAEQVKEESTIEGLGELAEFNPHVDSERPPEPGIYVLYDISERPI
jgi:transcriptional regulator with XRE-family HTH domain